MGGIRNSTVASGGYPGSQIRLTLGQIAVLANVQIGEGGTKQDDRDRSAMRNGAATTIPGIESGATA